MRLCAVLGLLGVLCHAASAQNANTTAPQAVSSCPAKNQLCFSVLIPPPTSSSGNGDIFIQIQAPASYEWAALGQGLEMAGSNMFIIYSDAATNNVTLSPRLGISEVEPTYNGSQGIELLAGSGIADGFMTANIRCSSCASWPGGNMTLDDPNSSWIWAYKEGSPLNTDALTTNLNEHDFYGTMILDLSRAVGGLEGVNPFVKANGQATVVTGSTAGSSSDSGPASQLLTAHGILMGSAMLIVFPVGVILRRLAPKTSIWTHASIQSVGLVMIIVGAALGVMLSKAMQGGKQDAHGFLGLFVLAAMLIQPVLGVFQHRHFKKHGTRSAFGWSHRVLGCLALLLGVINGGLGLQVANNIGTTQGNTYILGAAVIGCIFTTAFAATAFAKRNRPARKRRTRRHRDRYRHNTWLQLEDRDAYPTNPPAYPTYREYTPPKIPESRVHKEKVREEKATKREQAKEDSKAQRLSLF